MTPPIRRTIGILSLSLLFILTRAQAVNEPTAEKGPRPYQLLTSGKQITLKSKKNIQHVMLWTSGGHRVVEQREINAPTYSFTIPVNEKMFFLMVGFEGGKVYTEKIGVR